LLRSEVIFLCGCRKIQQRHRCEENEVNSEPPGYGLVPGDHFYCPVSHIATMRETLLTFYPAMADCYSSSVDYITGIINQ
jgi:hypothetical protein